MKLQEGTQVEGQFYMPMIGGARGIKVVKPTMAAPKKQEAVKNNGYSLEGYNPNKLRRVKVKKNYSIDKVNIMQVKVHQQNNDEQQQQTAVDAGAQQNNQPFGI